MPTVAQVKERIQDLLEERADNLGRETGFIKRGAPTQRSRLCPGIGLWTASRPGAFNGRIGNDLGTPSGAHQRVGSVPAFHGRSRDVAVASLGGSGGAGTRGDRCRTGRRARAL